MCDYGSCRFAASGVGLRQLHGSIEAHKPIGKLQLAGKEPAINVYDVFSVFSALLNCRSDI